MNRYAIENALHDEVAAGAGLSGDKVIFANQNMPVALCPYITLQRLTESPVAGTLNEQHIAVRPVTTTSVINATYRRDLIQCWRLTCYTKSPTGSVVSTDYLERVRMWLQLQPTTYRLQFQYPAAEAIGVVSVGNCIDISRLYGIEYESVTTMDVDLHVISLYTTQDSAINRVVLPAL